MRRKFRIFSTLTAMALVLVVLCVGIWAATAAKITGTDGQLSVTATTDILATIEFNFGESDKQIIIFDTNDEDDASQYYATKTVNLPSYTYAETDENKSKSFTITITNDYTDDLTALDGTLVINLVDKTNFSVNVTGVGYNSGVLAIGASNEGAKSSITLTVTITYNGNYGAAINNSGFSLEMDLNVAS